MKTAIVKLKGRKSGFACKIFIRGEHVATVANPDRMNEAGAREAAFAWDRDWRPLLMKG